MRWMLIGAAAFFVLLMAGFVSLLIMAETMTPERETVRVEIEDDFPR